MPGDDAVPVLLDEADEVFDGLPPAALGAVAPAAQVCLGIVHAVVVEGLEVLAPAVCPGGGQTHRRAGQPG